MIYIYIDGARVILILELPKTTPRQGANSADKTTQQRSHNMSSKGPQFESQHSALLSTSLKSLKSASSNMDIQEMISCRSSKTAIYSWVNRLWHELL